MQFDTALKQAEKSEGCFCWSKYTVRHEIKLNILPRRV